jgi:V/A-type H+-transporting ATPase subunit E
MNGADKITERIISEARQKAEVILQDATQRAEAIKEEAVRAGERERQEILKRAELEAQEHIRRRRTISELEMRKALLETKQEMIEKAFHNVLKTLGKLPPVEYQDVVYSLLKATVSTGEEELIIAQKDEDKYTPEFLERVNQGLMKAGKKGALRLAQERRDLEGGFILKYGGVEVNNSFESLLRMERDEIEPEVAKVLFDQ